jgi:hypothetical protein
MLEHGLQLAYSTGSYKINLLQAKIIKSLQEQAKQ